MISAAVSACMSILLSVLILSGCTGFQPHFTASASGEDASRMAAMIKDCDEAQRGNVPAPTTLTPEQTARVADIILRNNPPPFKREGIDVKKVAWCLRDVYRIPIDSTWAER